MKPLDPADMYFVCFAFTALIAIMYLYGSSFFIKASTYQFVDALSDEQWKDVSEIKREMESRLRGRLRITDVKQALDNLEREGVVKSRNGKSIALFLPGTCLWMSLPERQFKLHRDDTEFALHPDPRLSDTLVTA